MRKHELRLKGERGNLLLVSAHAIKCMAQLGEKVVLILITFLCADFLSFFLSFFSTKGSKVPLGALCVNVPEKEGPL